MPVLLVGFFGISKHLTSISHWESDLCAHSWTSDANNVMLICNIPEVIDREDL